MGLLSTLTGDGLLQAGSGLIGGLFGAIGQRKANEANMKINQMNNEFNERMLDKQLSFQNEMWEKTNEYNTASNQRKRLEEAGLNPYMMMNGGNAGTASSMSGGSASAASPIPMQNVGTSALQGATALGGLVESLARTRNMIYEGDVNKVNSDMAFQMSYAKLANIYAQTGNYQALRDLNNSRYRLINENFDTMSESYRLQNELNRRQINYLQASIAVENAKASTLNEQLKWIPAEKLTNILYTMAATGEVTSRSILNSAQAEGVKLNNYQVSAIQDIYITYMRSQYHEGWRYNVNFPGYIRAGFDRARAKYTNRILSKQDTQLGYKLQQLYYDYPFMSSWGGLNGFSVNGPFGIGITMQRPF